MLDVAAVVVAVRQRLLSLGTPPHAMLVWAVGAGRSDICSAAKCDAIQQRGDYLQAAA